MYDAYVSYHEVVLSTCHMLWTSFNEDHMLMGCLVLGASVVCLVVTLLLHDQMNVDCTLPLASVMIGG